MKNPKAASESLIKETESSVSISFVLPVMNEQESLEELYKQITAEMEKQNKAYELIFVDDGSSDNSFQVLSHLRQTDPRIRVIQFRRNFGKAAAYKAGFHHARGNIVVTMDTDLQDSPEDLPLFFQRLDEGYELVVGWKYMGKGSAEKSIPSRIFNNVVAWVTGIKLNDFNCPFKAYRTEVLNEIDIHGELYRYIPVLAVAKGFSVSEVKIRNLPRQHGVSKYGIKRYYRGMFDLMTVVFVTRFSQRPLHLLGLVGIFCSLSGTAILSSLLSMHLLYFAARVGDSSWILHERPLMSLGVLLLILGVQVVSIGLVGELIVSSRKMRPEDKYYSIRQILEN